jgi:hypothetical protein
MHSMLHGWTINRTTGALRWEASKSGELRLRADTLEGLRSLIRDHPNHDR